MGVSDETGNVFETVRARHRLLVIVGMSSTFLGIGIASYVGFRWFVQSVSHEVLAIVAALLLLLGVQVLVFTSLTSMLIRLHEELIRQVGE